jgi:O-antigen/teichoic acid export membrane protein
VTGADHVVTAAPQAAAGRGVLGARARSLPIGRLIHQVAQRFTWGLADQAVSSLTNAAVSLYIARALGAAQFGAFSLAYVTYSFALTASRGLATDPLLVRYSSVEVKAWKRAVAASTGTATVMGLITGTVSLMIGAATSGTTRLAFIALGLTLPGLLLQDAWRYSFFALGKGGRAFANDAVWALTLLIGLLALKVTHHQTVFWYVLTWGITGCIGGLVGPLQAKVTPRLIGVAEWVHITRDLGPRYLMENTANSGSAQLRIYFLGFVTGLTAVGYVQEGSLLMGPFFVIFMGISLVTVPEAARTLRRSPAHLKRYCVLVGAALCLLALSWGVLLMIALPHGLGSLLLKGDNWKPVYGLVPAMVISMMGACAIAGATAGLRALGAAKRSLRSMLVSSAIYVILAVIGASLDGAQGTTAGTAVATWLGAVMWWWQLRLGLRDYMEAAAQRASARRVSSNGRHRAPGQRPPAATVPRSTSAAPRSISRDPGPLNAASMNGVPMNGAPRSAAPMHPSRTTPRSD